MSYLSDWEFDLQQEKIISKQVENTLFNPYLSKKASIIRYDDKAHQLNGIDYELITKYQKQALDIKAQARQYIANPTPTFCLELDWYKHGEHKLGWYRQPWKATTHYGFIWIDEGKRCQDEQGRFKVNSPTDIEKYRLMILNVSKVRQFTESHGLNEELYRKVIQQMREEELKIKEQNKMQRHLRIFYDLKTQKLSDNYPSHQYFVSFVLTAFGKSENPINLVVKNNEWKDLCDAYYDVSKNSIIIYKEHGEWKHPEIKYWTGRIAS